MAVRGEYGSPSQISRDYARIFGFNRRVVGSRLPNSARASLL